MPIARFAVAVTILLIVGVVLLTTTRDRGLRGVVAAALFGGVLCGVPIAGGVWLTMDTLRSIEITQLVHAIGQLDDLARAGEHSASAAVVAACRADPESGTATITALGRLHTALFHRRMELRLIDANGQPVQPSDATLL